MKRVGLTGGIGSGKSTVREVFRVLGVPVFDADSEAKRLMTDDAELRAGIGARFGMELFGPDGLDRKALAAKVFGAPQALADLNAMVHPAVRAYFAEWAAAQRAPYVIMEAAILVETGGYKAFDVLITVSAPEAMRIARVMQRDGVEEKDVRARMESQASDEERAAVAQHVVVNDGSVLIIPQVLAIHQILSA